ncbi:ATP synthase F1 subunit epsilon [Tuwongella immobilis]|uniref:ATP synthase epsilon chain n=1 Tax=Tuwongella immobilis TaxID=692036 RepID=A0A6C2YQ80_9BACT|nr:ATP synthase F1 subunit epsilon [Tuwongella immobilis]VIP03471.1 atp synthase epsilon subunit : ATP synthase epsilon chain OS=Singulisphaera acidiphila (strain ATCC BAA-1392 / DSM 18658 / VKM B-2454 / MOB10) GN=atpC PE=3 SV=1: ATP-synt_DE_N [Tuwongella immobilis]VTS04314.1 atp synthase epsilon subunit : ATP synthase epsilon chain OS=Singulisphaera acidiphila (strain ATCC BAA-1392 / DSM 18658 / VKM B-2454 / MOB10) GN=atpC PE=3 SV=1: ATP-synt_DE_N [Tuwongella immobilis]
MAESTGKRLQCVIVTPERAFLDEQVDSVIVPLFDGEFGVLPLHEAFVGRLAPGELRFVQAGTTKRYFIDRGFVQFRDNVLTVLTSQARSATDLAAPEITQELANAEAMPKENAVQAESRNLAISRARAKQRILDKQTARA